MREMVSKCEFSINNFPASIAGLPETYKEIIKREVPLNLTIVLNEYSKGPNYSTSEKYEKKNLSVSQIKAKFFSERIIENRFEYQNYSVKISDNIWDFEGLNKAKDERRGFIIKFRNNNPEDNLLEKFYVINHFVEYGFRTNLRTKVNILSSFLFQLRNHGFSPFNVVDEDILEMLSYVNRHHYRTVSEFFRFVSELTDRPILSEKMHKYLIETGKRTHAEIENNKTPLLETHYYEKVKKYYFNLFSREEDLNKKLMLGIIIIQMTTGLRLSEATRLKRDCMMLVDGHEDKMLLHYINTKSLSMNVKDRYIPILPDVVGIIKEMQTLSNSDLLVGSKMSSEKIIRYYTSTMEQGAEELKLKDDYDGVRKNINGISIAPSTSYRVYQISKKRHIGIPPRVISQMYGHTSFSMEDYYARAPHQLQDDTQQLELLAQHIFSGKRLLGAKADIRNNQIDQAEKAQGKIHKDVMELAELLGGEFEVKKKKLGYCMKSIGRSCEKDQDTDAYDCAFDLCSNTVFFFFNIDKSYKEFQNTCLTYHNAYDNEQFIVAEKELQKINRILNKYVIPQIKELKKEIAAQGKEAIIEQFDNLSEIINRIDEIESEVNLWTTKCQTLNS